MNLSEQYPKLRDLLFEMADVADFLWQRGWAERNAGNISVNISDIIDDKISNPEAYPFVELPSNYPELADKSFIVSGTGKRMRDLARDPLANAIIILLNEAGNAYRIISAKKETLNHFAPTSELPTHLGIHQMIAQKGSKDKVVLHTHVSELVALTQIEEFCNEEKLNRLFWGMHPETMVFVPKGVGFVPYVTPGTEDIAVETLKALERSNVALWEKHGVFAISDSPYEAFDTIDILAKSAKIFFLTKSAGYQAQGLTDEQLKVLKDLSESF